MQYDSNSFDAIETVETLCYCTDEQHYNCTVDELGTVYPGQTYMLSLIISNTQNLTSVVIVSIDNRPNRACNNHNMKNNFKLFQNTCTAIDYKILYNSIGSSCELYLRGSASRNSIRYINSQAYSYRIKILPCPIGFKYFEIPQMCQS